MKTEIKLLLKEEIKYIKKQLEGAITTHERQMYKINLERLENKLKYM